jgi:nucleotide-binding universal stress UspA family protein
VCDERIDLDTTHSRVAIEGHAMSYPSILVALDNQPECVARTETVLALAKTMGSYATRAALAFDVACEIAGVAERKALVEESDMSTALNRRGRVNDLIVLTQSDPRAHAGQAFKNPQIEETILASARPVIVLPYANAASTLGTRVLVAWDDSRAAARALADALPLLRRAHSVQVMQFNRDESSDEGGLSSDLASVGEWLARHGVPARTQVETNTISVAEALLSRAADLGSDLIVMGAFGHARWRERLLGGTTRDVLGTMTVPVLMSH